MRDAVDAGDPRVRCGALLWRAHQTYGRSALAQKPYQAVPPCACPPRVAPWAAGGQS